VTSKIQTKTLNTLKTQDLIRQHCSLLASLDEIEIDALVEQSEVIHIAAGEALLKARQPVEQAYIVLEGQMAVLVIRDWGEPRIIDQIAVGGMIGEIELLSGEACLTDVKALEDSRLLCLSRRVWELLLDQHNSVWNSISELARKRSYRLLMTQQINELFGSSGMEVSDPLLRLNIEEDWLNFEQDILQQLEENIDWLTVQRGDYLFRKGDKPDGAFVLVSGLLGVSLSDDSPGEYEIVQIRHGEIVGELGLIMDAERSASVRALRDSELFRLSPNVFTRVMERYPRRLVNVYRTITERFYKNVSGTTAPVRNQNIAFIPATPEMGFCEFTRELFSALSECSIFELLTSQSVDEALGCPGLANSDTNELENARLVHWLNGHDSEAGLVIYQGDKQSSNWSGRCVRQSDILFIVADVQADPELTAVSSHVTDTDRKWNLVLLHPADTDRPRNSARWLENGNFNGIYHVRRHHAGDLARLARIVGGRATSLVLGGGGARGFAHIGVLKALEELGVTIDMIGGTSIGAPIAGWIAQGKNAEQIKQSAINAFKSLIDVTLPVTSMISGKRISKVIFQETAEWDIEDYWLPFFCVSTSLTNFKSKIHRRGNSARAIRSSVSIPGVLPPVPDGDELLVDGGVLNNLPIDIMRNMNPYGIVIAADVVAKQGMEAREDYGYSVSGWRKMLGKFLPGMRPPKTPPIANVLMQSMMVGSSHERERVLQMGLADHYQNINVKGIGLLQFEEVEKAANIGYQQSIGPLREWVDEVRSTQIKHKAST